MTLQEQQPKIEFNPGAIGDSNSLREAFSKLAHAEACARDSGCSVWEYAIEIERLLANGLWASDLRWLVNKGYVAHAVEITRSQDKTRRFQPCDNLSFTQRTCFVITQAGSLMAANSGLQSPNFRRGDAPGEFPRLAHCSKGSPGVPGWDYGRRILHVNGRIVKQYRVPSPGQEAILSAFQEDGWPPVVADPLAPLPDQDPKERLRHTIRALNANQKEQLIRFRGDGTGQGVIWELIEPDMPEPTVKPIVPPTVLKPDSFRAA